ncbi:MAG TPA: NTP transferase domain-containing protein [Spirochaetales bacterium]|nr:NTP transferase domain-containing protein [Spirochaetales bacterium]
MDAVLLAGGGSDPTDPLHELAGGRAKALLPIAGKSMGQWVLDALEATGRVGRIVVVGLGPDCGLRSLKIDAWLPDTGSLFGNARSGAEAILSVGGGPLVLLASVDVPALLPSHVDWVVDRALETEDDFYYSVIDRAIMEREFPGSGRSYIRFRDREVCGGDLTVIRPAALAGSGSIWKRLTAGRKSSARIALSVGVDVLLKLLFRRLAVADAVRIASGRLGFRGRALDCPHAELGMDVDKPFQHAMLERFLGERT